MHQTRRVAFIAISAVSAMLAQGPQPGRGFDHGMRFLGVEGGRPGATVTGAPFSGQEVTTETQTLANGTHIQHSNTTQFYRDAQGRTRIERTFSGMGPSAAGKAPRTTIEIFDPVAGVGYFLNTGEQTATKMTLHQPDAAQIAKHQAERQAMQASEPEITTSLGTQTIQGLPCTGTQITRTLAAGTVGNDQAITITSQRWYSADLQLTLKTTRNDPRMGEVDSAFQNISRAAPDASLFQVPSGYTITAKTAGHRGGQGASSGQ